MTSRMFPIRAEWKIFWLQDYLKIMALKFFILDRVRYLMVEVDFVARQSNTRYERQWLRFFCSKFDFSAWMMR